jgi:hypothetical protein
MKKGHMESEEERGEEARNRNGMKRTEKKRKYVVEGKGERSEEKRNLPCLALCSNVQM